jgi:glucokinase
VILAVDIGGTRFRVAAVDRSGRLQRVVRRKTNVAGGATWMIEQVLDIGERLSRDFGFQALGIGFGGPVDYEGQRILNSTHVPGWDNVALADLLGDALGVPAVVDNDANVGAVGEFTFGAGQNLSSIVYYTISTGIGGGIIIDGKVYRGANGNAGELGHVPILKGRPLCACGNRGCLEALCSGPAIAKRGTRAMRQKGLTAKDVFDAARTGQVAAQHVVDETVAFLGMGIATTINTLAPEAVVIGGGVSRAGLILFQPLRTCVRQRVMPVHRGSVRILQAKRGDNAVLLGAASMAQDLA